MPEVTVERRNSPRYSMVLAADVISPPGGAKMSARTSDISRSGYYVDTLNPIPRGSRVKLRFTHHQEEFEAIGWWFTSARVSVWVYNSRKSRTTSRLA